jgi:hypothetical protein
MDDWSLRNHNELCFVRIATMVMMITPQPRFKPIHFRRSGEGLLFDLMLSLEQQTLVDWVRSERINWGPSSRI